MLDKFRERVRDIQALRREMRSATARQEIRSKYNQNHDPSRSQIQDAIGRYREQEHAQVAHQSVAPGGTPSYDDPNRSGPADNRGTVTGASEHPLTRELLELERTAALARIEAMGGELDGIVESTAESNIDDEHDPEGATIAFERARLTALLDEARASVNEIDRSLQKFNEGRYGTCEVCGIGIAAERLMALPSARLCVGCAASEMPDARQRRQG